MMIWFAIGLLRAWELVGGGDHHLSDAVRLWRTTKSAGRVAISADTSLPRSLERFRVDLSVRGSCDCRVVRRQPC